MAAENYSSQPLQKNVTFTFTIVLITHTCAQLHLHMFSFLSWSIPSLLVFMVMTTLLVYYFVSYPRVTTGHRANLWQSVSAAPSVYLFGSVFKRVFKLCFILFTTAVRQILHYFSLYTRRYR